MMSIIIESAQSELIEAAADASLALRLRFEREARGWTLADFASRSGVSRAMLSKIERREASPTAALLGRLSAALGLTLSQLFARMEAEPGVQVTHTAQQPIWQDPETGYLRRSLSPTGALPLELVWGELPPGADIACPAASLAFVADQQLVVIAGELAVESGRTTHLLVQGDCLRFGQPADMTFRNPGAARCRYILAILHISEAIPPTSRSRPGGHSLAC